MADGEFEPEESAVLQPDLAGANAVQFYSGLVYGGPGLVARMLNGMIARIERDGAACIADYTNKATESWAAKAIPA